MNDSAECAPGASLERTSTDNWVSLGRAFAGALPVIGAAVGEVLAVTIRNQQQDRIIAVLADLADRMNEVEKAEFSRRIEEDPEARDLFQEGMAQATRAVGDDRRKHIAALLKSGLTAEEITYAEDLHLWHILSQLNDVELLILQSYGVQHTPSEEGFREQHDEVLRTRSVHTGSSPEEVDQAAIYSSFRQHLVDMGLLRPRFKRPKRGELPEFDEKTGMMKATGFMLTSLGRLFLRRLDLPVRET